jgi:DNA-binding NarL/FixJ family response regulator
VSSVDEVASVTIRVVLIEDHPIVVDGLRASFAERTQITITGEAVTLAEGRLLLATAECDVILLDLRLPDGSGVDILRELRSRTDPPAVLVLSSFMTPEYVSTAVALGASGFLLKTSPADEIVDAIEQIAGGGLAFTPDQLRVSRNASWAPLTIREHDVLDGIMRGRSNDEIAMDLGIAKKTVEGYISRLLARYDVLTRTELALHAERRQLLDLPTKPQR